MKDKINLENTSKTQVIVDLTDISLKNKEDFLRCYKDSLDFRKMIDDNRDNLSEVEIYILDELKKTEAKKKFDMIITQTPVEYDFKIKSERIKAAIMAYISDLIVYYGNKNSTVPSYDEIYSILEALFFNIPCMLRSMLCNAEDSIRYYYKIINNFTAYDDEIAKKWFCDNKLINIDIPNILNLMLIDVDSFEDLEPVGKVTRKNWY